MAKHVALVGRIYDTGATKITTGFESYLVTGIDSLGINFAQAGVERDYKVLNYLVVSDRAQPDD